MARMTSEPMPSRKDKILIFTVLGWAVCAVFAFVSYSMAKEDLTMIDQGLMDGRDRSTIDLMRILSLVQIILICLAIPLMCCAFGMSFMAESSSYGGGYGGD